MDRFIEIEKAKSLLRSVYLKSNMDRFIDLPILVYLIRAFKFKIQYG